MNFPLPLIASPGHVVLTAQGFLFVPAGGGGSGYPAYVSSIVVLANKADPSEEERNAGDSRRGQRYRE